VPGAAVARPGNKMSKIRPSATEFVLESDPIWLPEDRHPARRAKSCHPSPRRPNRLACPAEAEVACSNHAGRIALAMWVRRRLAAVGQRRACPTSGVNVASSPAERTIPGPATVGRVEIVYVLVPTVAAAAFAYLATLKHKRHEVERERALVIDADLQDALDLALLDTVDSDPDLSNRLISILRRCEHRTVGLPESSRKAVHDQIHVVTFLAYMFWDEESRHPVGPWVLQLALHAAREVLSPLVYPPPVLNRGPGKPESFPDADTLASMLDSGAGGIDAALDWSRGRQRPGGGTALDELMSPERLLGSEGRHRQPKWFQELLAQHEASGEASEERH
jgi:hypothetical protein